MAKPRNTQKLTKRNLKSKANQKSNLNLKLKILKVRPQIKNKRVIKSPKPSRKKLNSMRKKRLILTDLKNQSHPFSDLINRI